MGDTSVYPPAELLCKVMELASEKLKGWETLSTFHLRALTFHHQTPLLHKQSRGRGETLKMTYDGCSGKVEVMEKEVVLLTGLLLPVTHFPNLPLSRHLIHERDGVFMDSHSIYRFVREKGLTHSHKFHNISEILISKNGFVGKVKWGGSCESYLDSIMKMIILYTAVSKDSLTDISSIEEFIYDPSWKPEQEKDVLVYYDGDLSEVSAEGVRMRMLKTKGVYPLVQAQLETQVFLPFSHINSESEFLEVCLQIVHETAQDQRINIAYVEKSQLLDCLLESQYLKTLSMSQVNFSFIQCKDEKDLSQLEKGFYLFLSDTVSPLTDSLARAIDSCDTNSFYLVQSAPLLATNCFPKFKALTPILKRTCNGNKMLFYKKTIQALIEANFIQVPEGYLLEKPTTQEELIESHKPNFLMFKFNDISDIRTLMEGNKTYLRMKCTRLVFSNDVRSLDPTNLLLMTQLNKDVKINIWHNGAWGCLKNVSTPSRPPPS